MKRRMKLLVLAMLTLALSMPAMAQEATAKKTLRIALAGLFEEVNTFADESMGTAKITGNMTTGFQGWSDEKLIQEYKGTETYMGGFIDAFEEFPDVEIVPTVFWSFSAGGTIDGDAYQQMKQDILDRLEKALPLDGVALCMHGAGVAEGGIDDAETDLAAAIREKFGPDLKVISAQDHHSNLSDDDVTLLNLLTQVHHYPHTDMYDAAYRAAKLLPAMIKGDITPHGYFERLPMLMQCLSTMDGNLYAPVRRKVEEIAKREGIYEFSIAYGFPFADVPDNSPVVNVWAESPELAEHTAKEAATLLWENRARFVAKPISAEEAVRQALSILVKQGRILPEDTRPILFDEAGALLANDALPQDRSFMFLPDADNPGPIVIADKADNPGGGAPQDGTHLLRELISNKVEQAAVCAIRDPETVQQALKAGIGSVIDVELGGKGSKIGGAPIQGKAYVKSISDGRYTVVSAMGTGSKFDVGPAVGLLIDGIDVAVVSGLMQSFDANQMKMLGFDPNDYRIVVVKSANHFRAWWTDVASEIIDCDTPGIASNDLSSYEFTKKTRKLYPLDADAVYPEPAK